MNCSNFLVKEVIEMFVPSLSHHALAWVMFILIKIIAQLIIIFKPDKEFSDSFILPGFSVENIAAYFCGHSRRKEFKSSFDMFDIENKDILDCPYARALENHINLMRLYGGDLINESSDDRQSFDSTIEQKPRSEVLQCKNTLSENIGHISNGKRLDFIGIQLVHHSSHLFDYILIDGELSAIQLKNALMVKIGFQYEPVEKLGYYDTKQCSANTDQSVEIISTRRRHFAPPCGEKIVVNQVYHREGLVINGGQA